MRWCYVCKKRKKEKEKSYMIKPLFSMNSFERKVSLSSAIRHYIRYMTLAVRLIFFDNISLLSLLDKTLISGYIGLHFCILR